MRARCTFAVITCDCGQVMTALPSGSARCDNPNCAYEGKIFYARVTLDERPTHPEAHQ